MNTIFGSIISICVILFFWWFWYIFYKESKVDAFRRRMYEGNKYISKKLSISKLNPYHDYELINLLGWKPNIGGITYVRYSLGDQTEEYTASIYDFMKEFRIYKYAEQADSKYKKEIHQPN